MGQRYNVKNKVELQGLMVDDIRINEVATVKCAEFSLQTTEVRRDPFGALQTEQFKHRIICWNKLADIVEKYAQPGMELIVEGRLTQKVENGINVMSVYATDVLILTTKAQ